MKISPNDPHPIWEQSDRLETKEAVVRFCQGILGSLPKQSPASGPLGRVVSFDPNSDKD